MSHFHIPNDVGTQSPENPVIAIMEINRHILNTLVLQRGRESQNATTGTKGIIKFSDPELTWQFFFGIYGSCLLQFPLNQGLESSFYPPVLAGPDIVLNEAFGIRIL